MPATEPSDRRARRTQRALRDAFVSLVLERGYDKVTIEDITERADVARATFYAHFMHKEDLLTDVFTELIRDLAPKVRALTLPTEILTRPVEAAYRHAAEFRDIYRVCLSGAGNGLARDAYLKATVELMEENLSERQSVVGAPPRIPLAVMARVYAGAHVALLYAWVSGQLDYSAEEMARMQTQALYAGLGWGHGIAPEDLTVAQAPGGHSTLDDLPSDRLRA
jgi:AcrR family transcriptional regulator